ncbi:hypothetical protein Agub_g2602, partial [Astrephomene gubernaculifera]
KTELCSNFVLGRCNFGERCKFGHDLSEYVRSKPADLPGTCPWTAVQATCPYGITCRYALSHGVDDEAHKLLAATPAQQPPQPPSLEPQPAAEGAAAPAAGAEGTPAVAAAAAATEAAEAPAGSGIPAQLPLPLPLPTSIEKEVNSLSREVQTQLWKNRYDFSRADGILRSMGLRISFKHEPKPLSGGRPGGDGKGDGEQKDGPAASAATAAAAPEAAVAAAQPGQEPLQQVAEPAVAAAGAPDAMQTDGAVQTSTGAEATAPDGVPSVAAAGEAPEEAPAAKRQRLDSDAAAVATLVAEQDAPAAAATAAPATASAAAAAAQEARSQHVEVPLRPVERRVPDFRGKTYLAPLTTVGNLPFRRICKSLGVDVTCGEMALATNLLQGQASEWALLKRHPSEDFFGVQICGGYPDAVSRCCQLLGEHLQADFVDINMGCPIDLVCDKSAGSALLRQPRRIEQIVRSASAALGERTALTFKTRKGYNDGEDVAHTFLHRAREWGAAAVTLHGRTRQQRYSKLADWGYIRSCASSCAAAGLQLIGNGDVFSFTDWNAHMQQAAEAAADGEGGGAAGGLAALMVGRGALIKPWIFTEIKEQRHWDISAGERLDLYRSFCAAGLEHWGSDGRGVETTRRFLLEWLSFSCRYVPVGLLEVLPQQMNHRPPAYRGRSDLETLLASEEPQDWVRISEMLLGPPPAPISFAPKHKSSSYAAAPGAASELDMA